MQVRLVKNYKLAASFDIDNLYNNLPLGESINILKDN